MSPRRWPVFRSAAVRHFGRPATLAWLVTCLLSSPAWCQLPVADLTSVFPLGGSAGSTVEVTLAGNNLDEATRLVFSHPGITATVKTAARHEFLAEPEPVAGQFTVTIAPDVPAGMYDVRAIGRFGASNPRTFIVSRWAELLDEGNNHDPSTAKEIPVPSSVSGRAEANRYDYYKIKLGQGQRVLVTVWAQQIESRMDASVAVLDADGHELIRNLNTDGLDPVVDFTAPVEGEYIIAVWDFLYEGGADHFYRLNVHSDPRIDFVFPPSGLPGSTGTYTVYGRNLPGGKPSAVQLNGAPLDELSVEITLPNEPDALEVADNLRPTVAQLDGIAYRLSSSLPTTLTLAKAPVVLEQPGDENPDAAQRVEVPCEIAGQFYPESDGDWYVFEAKQGETYVIDVISHRLGLPTDPYLSIERLDKAEDGTLTATPVAQVDDPPNRPNLINSLFDTSTDDPTYQFTADRDATYRIMVRDQFGDGPADPRKVYRLVIRSPHPDFRLHAVPQELKVANDNEVRQTSLTLRRGATDVLRVSAERIDGYSEEIRISAENLPAGVSCPEVVLGPNQSVAYLVFTAAEDAAEWSGPIRIVGKAAVGGEEVTRIARPGVISWGTPNDQQTRAEYRLAREMYLSVIPELHKAMVRVAAEGVQETSLGGTLELPIQLVRREGFAEAIKLVASNVPAELKPADLDLAADATEGKLTIAVTNNKAQPGTYTFFLRADSKVSYSRNPEAAARAEAELAKLDATIAQIGEQVKMATATRDAADQQAQAAAAAVTSAEQAQAAAAQALTQAEAALKQATERLMAAQQAAQAAPNDSAAAAALEAARAIATAATAARDASAENSTVAAKALENARAAVAAVEQAKAAAEKAIQDLEARSKRAAEVKTAEEKRVADLKKASAPADVNIALISTPIVLRVVRSPVTLTSAAPAVAIQRGASAEAEVTIERRYGFAGPVELTLELPADLKGVTVEKVTAAADQTSAKFAITTTADAPAGEFTATVRATSQFNDFNADTTMPLTLRLE